MADKDDVNDDNIFDEGEMEDDGTADIIRKAYEESMKDEDDDDGGFDQPLDVKTGEEPDVVSPDKGRDLLDDADMAKSKGKSPGEKDADSSKDEEPTADKGDTPDDKSDGDKPKEEAKADDEGGEAKADAEGEKSAADLKEADVGTLLDGVPNDRKGEINRRLGDAERVLAPFKAHEAELQRHGQTPEGAINRLVELNTFAQTKPDEYLAWVASEIGKEPEKVLDSAAKLLGYKLVKDVEEGAADEINEDDEFLDPLTKKLIEENRQLKANQAAPKREFGPDTPERTQARTAQETLQSFVAETDETGKLRRPHFNHLRPRITELAAAHRAATGQIVGPRELQTFYEQAETEARSVFGAPVTPQPQPAPAENDASAAQNEKPVADQIKEKAAAAHRAQRASKSVDGTGQGASRRPALSDTASLDDVIRHFASQE